MFDVVLVEVGQRNAHFRCSCGVHKWTNGMIQHLVTHLEDVRVEFFQDMLNRGTPVSVEVAMTIPARELQREAFTGWELGDNYKSWLIRRTGGSDQAGEYLLIKQRKLALHNGARWGHNGSFIRRAMQWYQRDGAKWRLNPYCPTAPDYDPTLTCAEQMEVAPSIAPLVVTGNSQVDPRWYAEDVAEFLNYFQLAGRPANLPPTRAEHMTTLLLATGVEYRQQPMTGAAHG